MYYVCMYNTYINRSDKGGCQRKRYDDLSRSLPDDAVAVRGCAPGALASFYLALLVTKYIEIGVQGVIEPVLLPLPYAGLTGF